MSKKTVQPESVVVYGNQPAAIQAMFDYDLACGKAEPSVAAIIDPRQGAGRATYFFGGREIGVPTVPTFAAARLKGRVVVASFASARSAYATTVEALAEPAVTTVVIIAEGVSEREARLLRKHAKETGKTVIGPASVGYLSAGRYKIGNAGGTHDNIVANRLYQRGCIGIVSKSGGMLNELMTMAARSEGGVAEAVAIGGDRFPATRMAEQVLRYEGDPDVKAILVLGELGGTQEYEIAELIAAKKVAKPVIAWVTGTGAAYFKQAMQFGHAGALAGGANETAAAKNGALAEAGALVPETFQGLEQLLADTAKRIGFRLPEPAIVPAAPRDLQAALKDGSVRHRKAIVSSIAPSKDGAATYGGRPIHAVAAEKSLGYVLGLLWFKKEFPADVCALFELILKLTADHGPAVSGAHSTIVAARAGKDLVSSLASGLLTIGPRFGGAVNAAAGYFLEAVAKGRSAYDFVSAMKQQSIPIPGIGHRVKSTTNPDERVTLLLQSAAAMNHPQPYLAFAKEVETVTTRKKDSLILNVDGAIAAVLLDTLTHHLGSEAVRELVETEALNAFFVLGRSVGLIGHFIDQKRLKQPLYRHPGWDILDVE